jgi:glyoxylase-like metal-dependent hydrolase (beta-lactamase superfamily II)
MSTRVRRFLIGALALCPVVGFATTFCSSPLPPPDPLTGELPAAVPPAGMELFQLPTGITHRSAGFAYRGGSFRDARDFAMTAVLVKHPKGNLLIDTGFGRDIDAQFRKMPLFFRTTTSYVKHTPAVDQLKVAGLDPSALRGILITHAHWDHTSGVPDFPGVPVLVTREERDFVEHGGWITNVARSGNAKYEEYAFEGGPHLGFPRSHDVYGDGAVVVVPAGGHTPGSVVIFVTTPKHGRFAFVGDLVWQTEGITLREERPWLLRTLADVEPQAVRESIGKLAALHARFPEITLVPAHDSRGFAGLPQLR